MDKRSDFRELLAALRKIGDPNEQFSGKQTSIGALTSLCAVCKATASGVKRRCLMRDARSELFCGSTRRAMGDGGAWSVMTGAKIAGGGFASESLYIPVVGVVEDTHALGSES